MVLFRTSILTLAGALLCSAAWLLTVDFTRLNLPAFSSKMPAEEAAAQSNQAHVVALLGLIRGDLWAQYALSLSSALSRQSADDADPIPAIEHARAAAERAVSLSPVDAAVWLLLAQADLRLGREKMVTGLLKMSYYTGPNASDLFPIRLRVASQSDSITDPELQILVDGEMRAIVIHKLELRSTIGPAYRAASPSGKRFFEKTLLDIDPALLETLQSGG